jgi:hypothetical protein
MSGLNMEQVTGDQRKFSAEELFDFVIGVKCYWGGEVTDVQKLG